MISTALEPCEPALTINSEEEWGSLGVLLLQHDRYMKYTSEGLGFRVLHVLLEFVKEGLKGFL